MGLSSAMSTEEWGPPGGIQHRVAAPDTITTGLDSANQAAWDDYMLKDAERTKFNIQNPDLAMDYATSPGLMVADKLGLTEPYRTMLGLASPDLLKLFAAGGITIGKLIERLGTHQADLEEALAKRGGGLKAAMAKQKAENKVPIEEGKKGLAGAIDENAIELAPYVPKNAPKPASTEAPAVEPDLIPFDRAAIAEAKAKKAAEEAARKKAEEAAKPNPFKRR